MDTTLADVDNEMGELAALEERRRQLVGGPAAAHLGPAIPTR